MEQNNNKQFRIYDETGSYIRLSTDETIARGYNKWKDWKCSAGVKALYTDYDGNVWVCNTASTKLPKFNEIGFNKFVKENTIFEKSILDGYNTEEYAKLRSEFVKRVDAFHKPLDFTKENMDKYAGFVGNIYDGINVPTKLFTCPWSSCACGADVIIPKIKSDEYNDLITVNTKKKVFEKTLVDTIGEHKAVETNYPIDYQMLWDIGRRCNYSCSYCWPEAHNKTSPHLDFEVVKNYINYVIQEFSKGGKIRWYFGGGEPTLHPNFIEWMKYLQDRGQYTHVTTNGSMPPKFWKECIKYVNSVNMSAHFESIDEERFINNIKVICEYFDEVVDDNWLEIKLMVPPISVERGLRLKNQIINKTSLLMPRLNGQYKGAISLVPIRGLVSAGDVIDYSPEQLKILQNQ
jgi:hypothetical protein